MDSAERTDLARKVAFLRRPASYAEAPESVESIVTHMAWVFLTDRNAYKLKKPFKLPFLDFSTLERREEDCRLEVELNRRLADGVYLGKVPLTLWPHGGTAKASGDVSTEPHDVEADLELAGEGKIVDWLVHMRRLPKDRMLDERIRQGTITEDEIRRAAVLLADF